MQLDLNVMRLRKISELLFLFLSVSLSVDAVIADEIKIGLRAHRGAEVAMKRWQPTADYLNEKIPDHTFVLVPFEINSLLNQAVSRNEFHFVLTNPASFVEYKIRYGASPVATLINKRNGKGYTRFGSVIFTRADRDDINSFEDLKGKTFLGADELGFGGWRVTWYELLAKGIDPYKDFKQLSFAGGIQPNVVYAVRDGKFDAGAVRTDMLERMAESGKIQLDTFKVLEPKEIENFGFFHSTTLYPEWPFVKLKHTSDELARRVVAVLYNIPAESQAAIAGKYVGWTVPLDYQPVDDLLKDLRVGPYQTLRRINWKQVIETYWPYVLVIIIIFTGATITAYIVILYNRRLLAVKKERESEIVERKKAQTELENYHEHLEKIVAERTAALEVSNKELESYSYSIAHDLRSPLRSLIGFSQIIAEEASSKLNAEELDALDRIVVAGKRMADLIDDILELSRITRSQLNKTKVDLSEICLELANELQDANPDRKLNWHIQSDVSANGDRHLLRVMLQNLLDNAFKFSRDVPDSLVEFGVEDCDQGRRFYVRDNGIGIDMKYADKIFKPFHQLNRDEYIGTGVGLATVERVVQRHGGKVWVDSQINKGTIIYFTLTAEPKDIENLRQKI
ncbi:PhnD/SsuA/transferrin family substrate-binding protein [Kaarinaea lacus]